jgi:hypothetical protein
MSDLDDFFAKKLEEEASFPNRGKNWKQMSQRLDAFDSGMVKGNSPRLRAWQIATIVAVAVAGFLLWKHINTRRENSVLRQEVAALQSERSIMLKQLGELKKANSDVSLAEEASPSQPKAPESVLVPFIQGLKPTEGLSFKPESKVPSSEGSEKIHAPTISASAQIQPAGKEESMVFDPEAKAVISEGIEISKTAPMGTDTMVSQTAEVTPPKPQEDSLVKKAIIVDTLVAVVESSKEIIPPPVAAPAVPIKPLSPSKNRFRVGGQATIGLVQPNQKGVTSLRGQGITVEAKVFRSLWVLGSIDWLHHEVSTKGFVPKFHPPHDSFPKPPDGGMGGPPHQPKLVQVEGSPRRQQFALGIRYKLPVKFWLQPSVRMLHDWIRVSPTLVTYKFEEDDPGPNPHNHPAVYTAEKFGAQWLNNQWRFGLGLEKEIPNWTFSLWADYSKDFSAATPSFDVLYLRAGAQFRF